MMYNRRELFDYLPTASAFEARTGLSKSVRKGYKKLRVVSGNWGKAQASRIKGNGGLEFFKH